jgi:hypothetical protein
MVKPRMPLAKDSVPIHPRVSNLRSRLLNAAATSAAYGACGDVLHDLAFTGVSMLFAAARVLNSSIVVTAASLIHGNISAFSRYAYSGALP